MPLNKFQPFQFLYQQVRQYDPKLYQALDSISLNIQNLHSGVSTVIMGVAVASQFFSYNITSNTLIASPVTPSEGVLLILLLLEDATGHHLITWDALFGTVPDIGPADPNTYSLLTFIGHSARWWLLGTTLNQKQ